MEEQLAAQLVKAAKIVEEQLDEQILQLDHLEKNKNESELEELRRKRLIELRKMQERKQDLFCNGHGKLQELSNESDFFQAAKSSTKIVCHFFDVTNRISMVVDNILEKLTAKYISTRFVKVNAERVPFLIKRLNIRKLPTLGIAIDSQMVDFIRVLDEFGESKDLTLEHVENRLGNSGVIDYRKPASNKQKSIQVRTIGKKSIRNRALSSSDEGDD